eukprot:m.49097 g.49097  ORF g.49097 m.49097 type:complete len:227 (+) comp7434_c0_seq2:116-796(+)
MADIPTIANQLAMALQKISNLQEENLALKKENLELKALMNDRVTKRSKMGATTPPHSSSSDDDEVPTSPKRPTGKFSPHKDKDGSIHFALEKNKRVTISQFKGKTLVGIREWYEKGGKMLPGKGVSLSLEAWKELCAQMAPVQTAFENKNMEFNAVLSMARNGGQKKLSISEFRGNTYYNIREYFVGKDEKLLPTKKGTSLDEAAWVSLTELVPSVEAAIDDIVHK